MGQKKTLNNGVLTSESVAMLPLVTRNGLKVQESPPEFAVDGNEGAAGVLGDGDLLAGAGHHGVGARVERGGEDQPRRHVPQQRGSQQVRHRQQLLVKGQGSLVGRRHFC